MPRILFETFYRIAPSLPGLRRVYAPRLPEHPPPPPGERPLRLEIVSHSWRYARLLDYQLSSLVLHPPRDVRVRMTVFHAPEDEDTAAVLGYFAERRTPNVEWNPWPLEPPELFRRSIGRNRAARGTDADWIWFSDCDLLFRDGALDAAAAELRTRTDPLVYPERVHTTELLDPDHPVLWSLEPFPDVHDVDPRLFGVEDRRDRAVGSYQITRGDVARAAGYCETIPFYQRPVRRWQKTYEDRAYRWLLGTGGSPVNIPGLYRIRHRAKGRKGKRPHRVVQAPSSSPSSARENQRPSPMMTWSRTRIPIVLPACRI